jgi:hypothetical protein
MKKLALVALVVMLVIIAIILTSCSAIGQIIPGTGDTPGFIKTVVIALLALYEVIVRIIPTVSSLSVIGWIIRFLKWLSDSLDAKR